MRAYFAVGAASVAVRMLSDRNALVSYAMMLSDWIRPGHVADLRRVCKYTFLDSGAFTAWNRGKPIDLADYVSFVRSNHHMFDTVACLDVIGDPIASRDNWSSMIVALPEVHEKLLPVYHEGDPLEVLDQYVGSGAVVGIGRTSGRKSKDRTLELYDTVFSRHPHGSFHAFGNSDPSTLEPYPFFSFDSTTWERDSTYAASHGWPWSHAAKSTRMQAYIEATETIHHKPPAQGVLFK